MEITDSTFYEDLTSEDDVGLVLKGHLHIEHQLIELISSTLPFSERCDWSEISYRGKVELALSCGLKEDMRAPLQQVGALRNHFAHLLGASVEKKRVIDFYNALSERLREGLKESYKAVGRGELVKPTQINERDLLIMLLVNLRQAVKADRLTLQNTDPLLFGR